MTHLTDDTLFAAAGGQIDPGASSHLESCVECRARLASVRSLERALRAIPLEEPSPALAGAVLARIGLRESPSWLYTLLRNVGPLVALGAILAVVYLVMGPSAPTSSSLPAVGGESARTMFRLADEYGASSLQAINAWFAGHLAFAKGSGGLLAFLAFFLVGIALLDRYVLMPRFRRRA